MGGGVNDDTQDPRDIEAQMGLQDARDEEGYDWCSVCGYDLYDGEAHAITEDGYVYCLKLGADEEAWLGKR
jgi:hypothetical protein